MSRAGFEPDGEIPMYDAWSAGGLAGATALTFIAAGSKMKDGGDSTSMRINLPGTGNSLLGDVRVVGGALALAASRFTSGGTKRALESVAMASGLSVVFTEVVRYQLAKSGRSVAKNLPVFPNVPMLSFGADPAASRANSGSSSWAGR